MEDENYKIFLVNVKNIFLYMLVSWNVNVPFVVFISMLKQKMHVGNPYRPVVFAFACSRAYLKPPLYV